MPGGTYKVRVNARPPADDKLTRPDVAVSARPTDPFVRTFEDKDTSNILTALTSLVGDAGKLGGDLAGQAAEQGYRDMASGKDNTVSDTVWTIDEATGKKVPAMNPDGSVQTTQQHKVDRNKATGILSRIFTPAYLAGHDRAAGEAMSTRFQADALALFEEKGKLPKGEWQSGYNGLRQKYIAASGISQEFQDGFLHRALSVDQKIESLYAVQQAQIIHNKTKEDIATSFSNDVERYLTTTFAKINLPDGAGGTRPMNTGDLNTVAGYAAFSKASPELLDEMVVGIRNTISDRVAKYRGTMSTPEMAELTFNTNKQYAEALKLPQLYLYADKPDANGIKPVNAYDSAGHPMGLQIVQAALHAEELQRVHYNNLVALEERDNKKKINNAFVGLFETQRALGKMTGPEALGAADDMNKAVWNLFRMPGVSREEMALAEKLQKHVQEQLGHPAYTEASFDPATGRAELLTNQYWRRFVSPGRGLTVDDVLADQHRLSFEDSSFWLDKVGREQLSRGNKTDDGVMNAWTNAKIQLDKTDHELREWYNPTIGGIEMDPINGPRNFRLAKNALIEKYTEYALEHDGKAPTREEQEEMVKKVKETMPRPERKAISGSYKTRDENGKLIIPPTREAFAEVYKYYSEAERVEILKKLSAEGK
jgi:hypothetical protein